MSKTWTLNLYKELYNATINNEEIIVEWISDYCMVHLYCESFTSSDKSWCFNIKDIQLARNGGKVRFTYTEVPSGTEYSYFKEWSKKYV